MAKEIAAPFVITCCTNTLMGSGKSNYGVIDQLVQRDPATLFPCFNGSGIKGALKEFSHHAREKGGANIDLKYIFGSDKLNDEDTQAGAFSFWQADLLTIPVRNSSNPLVHITSPLLLTDAAEKLTLAKHPAASALNKLLEGIKPLLVTHAAISADENLGGSFLEDEDIIIEHTPTITLPETLQNMFPAPLAFVPDGILKILTDDLHLPVIARNRLLNGESKNLWYEQVLPRQTRMISYVQHWDNDEHFTGFSDLISANLVQLGSNASIGYGYCHFKKI
jgi:CRISPR-associated protein Cmr4